MTQTGDYRDDFFVKLKLKNKILLLLSITVIIASLFLLGFCSYMVICLMDRKEPIENMVYEASDAKIGGTTTVTMSFYRNRICAYSYVRMITDSKGRIVYKEQGDRDVNGPIREIGPIVEEYPIAINAAPGTATIHLYASWKCPGNLIHLFDPIRKEYTDTLKLSLAPGEHDLSDMSLVDALEFKEQIKKDSAETEKLRREQEESLSSVKGK